MKTTTLKKLIHEAARGVETKEDLLTAVLNLIELYETDGPVPAPQPLQRFRDYTPVSGERVPYHTICSCNPANGGSGVCGCVMGNMLVDPLPRTQFKQEWQSTSS